VSPTVHASPIRILAGLVVGGLLGALLVGRAPGLVHATVEPFGQIWLALLLVWMLPLASTAGVLGVVEIEPAALAKKGLAILGLTVGLTSAAVAIGLALVAIVQPGVGLDPKTLPGGDAVAAAVVDPVALVVELFPSNVVAAAAGKNLVPVLVFALVFGLALRTVQTPGALRLRELVQGVFDVSAAGTHLVLRAAPLGVAALTFRTAWAGGIAGLLPIGWFVAVVLIGLALQMGVVYPVVLAAFGADPRAFYRNARPALAVAFSTASSAATLPTSIEVAESALKLDPATSRFVLTVGATGNQNGTALFEGVAVLFLAQLYGVELGLVQQALVIAVAVAGGVGTAGVPGGALSVITAVSVSVGLPPESIAAIVGVDRLLDMARTTANVAGDLVICVAVDPKAA
jgi:DAACS family dicarboxylate/amino acid:cation (Na+ or H+) symporter